MLIPGLIDGHTHLAMAAGLPLPVPPEQIRSLEAAYAEQLPRSYLYSGFTTVIDPGDEHPSPADDDGIPAGRGRCAVAHRGDPVVLQDDVALPQRCLALRRNKSSSRIRTRCGGGAAWTSIAATRARSMAGQ